MKIAAVEAIPLAYREPNRPNPIMPLDLRFYPPTAPGVGVEILEDVVARYRQDRGPQR